MKVVVRNPRDIGALIRARRRALGLGQAELATKVGTSRLWITEIEKGKPRASLELVLRTISVLGLELTTDDEGAGQSSRSIDALESEMLRRQT